MLTQAVWEKLNNLSVKISRMNVSEEGRGAFMRWLRELVPFDVGIFFLTADIGFKNIQLTNCAVESDWSQREKERFRQDLFQMQDLDYLKWIVYEKDSIFIRESDFLNEEMRAKSTFYKRMVLNYKAVYGVSFTICHKEICLGCVSLHRSPVHPDFSDEELEMLKIIEPHLRTVLYKDYLETKIHRMDLIRAEFQETYGMTEREMELLEIILQGKDNVQISEEFHISINTVKKHFNNIFSKTGVANKYQLIRLLLDKGFDV